MEDCLQGKSPPTEDDLWWRQPLIEDNPWWRETLMEHLPWLEEPFYEKRLWQRMKNEKKMGKIVVHLRCCQLTTWTATDYNADRSCQYKKLLPGNPSVWKLDGIRKVADIKIDDSCWYWWWDRWKIERRCLVWSRKCLITPWDITSIIPLFYPCMHVIDSSTGGPCSPS